ncbi:MAG: SBBP repeat-containing protein, partial [Flavobacteriales bacterium]|nr:SBBP repeat-containing protein [Flavobacteriales bacterium]
MGIRFLLSILGLLFFTGLSAQQVDWVKFGGGGYYDSGNGIAVDQNGYSYSCGSVGNYASYQPLPIWGNDTIKANGSTYGFDGYVVKHDVKGKQLWSISLGGSVNDVASDIEMIGDTAFVVVGLYGAGNAKFGNISAPNPTSGYNLFVAKFDTSGTIQWLRTASLSTTYFYYYSNLYNPKVDVNESGDVVVSGIFQNTATFGTTSISTTTSGYGHFLVRYNNAGTQQWVRNVSGSNSNFYSPNVTIDTAGNAYLAGRFFGSITLGSTTIYGSGYDGYIAKISPTNSVLWLKGVSGSSTQELNGIAVDKFNNVYIAGRSYGTLTIGTSSLANNTGAGNSADAFIIRLNSSGNFVWGKSVGGFTGTYSQNDNIYGVEIDQKGNVGVTGEFGGSKSKFGEDTIARSASYWNRGIFSSLIDSSGKFIWTVGGVSSGTWYYNNGNGIALDTSKNIYITGIGSPPLVFENTVWQGPSGFGGLTDAYILKLADCSEAEKAKIFVGNSTSACLGDSIKLWSNNDPNLEYRWLRGGFGIYQATDTTFKAYATDDYRVAISDEGCLDTSKVIRVKINPLPNVTISNFPTTCAGQPDFRLTQGNPQGGIYKGIGIKNDTIFSATTSGVGSFNINYVYTDTNSCTDSSNKNISVGGVQAFFAALSSVCENAAPFNLAGGFPTGGTYIGTGVSANKFYPSVAGAGTHTIGYIATNLGCSDTATQTITVLSTPTLSLSSIPKQCASNFSPVSLSTYGSPAGGSYFGSAVIGTNFYPFIAGAGTHSVYYTKSNGTCSDTASTTVEVDPVPVATLSAFSARCANDGVFTLSGGSPAGGTYLYNNSAVTTFNPSSVGAGVYTIKYAVSNFCGSDTASKTITVNAQPIVSLGAFAAICSNSSNFTLSGGNPSGGSYFGNNISSGSFSPSGAGAGSHTINYTYTDANGCKDTASKNIVVNAAPAVSMNNLTSVCIDNGLVALSGGSPTPGTYTGTGVTGTNFNPATAGVGTHTITYKHTNANSCTDSASKTITVHALPVVSLSNLSSVCVNASSITLTGGSPAGGTYSGTGVTGTSFNPATAGVGTHTITYSYTDGNSCSNSASKTITVNAQPTVTLASLTAVCAGSPSFALSGGSPAGGTYTGTGVSSGNFNPSTAGAGSHTISYSYTDGNSCSNTATQTQVVHAQPTVSMNNLTSVCIDNGLVALSGGSPTPG